MIGPLTSPRPPEGLDPADWDAFRRASHQLLDRMLDLHQDIRQEPVWRPVPAEREGLFRRPAPRAGEGSEAVVREFLEAVAPYPTGNLHPRFWGWVSGTGSPMGLLAEMAAGGLNAISGIFNDAAARVEEQVVSWMKELLDFPPQASGVLTSGGSVANLVGLAVARDARAGADIRAEGVAAAGRLVLYASSEVHASVDKAAMVLGLGRSALRKVPVDGAYRIRVDLLEEAILRDRSAGLRPFAVVGCAGTVNTGAVDDLEALADLSAREGLWLHVDGAFGAAAALAPELRSLVRGMKRADSLAFDFHKWLYVPYEAGCVLVRDAAEHRTSFTVPASYLAPPPRGIGAQPESTTLRGLQLSRGFKALKVWMCFKEQGIAKLGRLIARNAAQARYLAERVEEASDLELLAPVPLNVVCFRYAPPELSEDRRNGVNLEVLMRLQERGIAAPSGTTLGGRFALRTAITNHRSRREDFDLLVEESRRLGREVVGEGVA